jgi:hypothetical protein
MAPVSLRIGARLFACDNLRPSEHEAGQVSRDPLPGVRISAVIFQRNALSDEPNGRTRVFGLVRLSLGENGAKRRTITVCRWPDRVVGCLCANPDCRAGPAATSTTAACNCTCSAANGSARSAT